MKPDKRKYHVISPDGFQLTHDPFPNRQAALEYIPKYREGLEHQGYYSAVGRRIPLDELTGHLTVVPESEVLDAMESVFEKNTTVCKTTLEQLMKEANEYVRASLSQTGKVPPTLLILGPDGTTSFSQPNMSDDAKKLEFLTTGRLMCIAQGAEAAVFCSGGWMRLCKKSESIEAAIALADSPEREEVAILVGESRGNNIQKILPVCRSEEEEFLGFGKGPETSDAKVTGQFAHFLPEDVPDKYMRLGAEAVLEAKGLVPVIDTEERRRGLGRSL